MKSLEGVELQQQADEVASTQVELLSALRFRNSRNKIDYAPPPYIVLWTKLIGDWPSIVNGRCRFALQARHKFIDQVRILAKSKIPWNHGRVLLCPGVGEKIYATFGIDKAIFQDTLWMEPSSSGRGLKRPASIQPGMLEFYPKSVQTSTIAKFCSMKGRSQIFAILEWRLVNPKKISEFLKRMKTDKRFTRLYKRIFDSTSPVVIQSEMQ